MGDSGAKGEEYRAKAEKKLKARTASLRRSSRRAALAAARRCAAADGRAQGFALFGNKYEDAVELLEKAANFFKLAKMCTCSRLLARAVAAKALARERARRDATGACVAALSSAIHNRSDASCKLLARCARDGGAQAGRRASL